MLCGAVRTKNQLCCECSGTSWVVIMMRIVFLFFVFSCLFNSAAAGRRSKKDNPRTGKGVATKNTATQTEPFEEEPRFCDLWEAFPEGLWIDSVPWLCFLRV